MQRKRAIRLHVHDSQLAEIPIPPPVRIPSREGRRRLDQPDEHQHGAYLLARLPAYENTKAIRLRPIIRDYFGLVTLWRGQQIWLPSV